MNYEIVVNRNYIGRGSFAVVYKGEITKDRHNFKELCIKQVKY